MDEVLPLLNSQGRILYVLGSGPKSSSELIELTKLSPSTLYYNLKDLMVRGLVARLRGGRYALTPRGVEVLNRLVEAFSQKTITPSPSSAGGGL